MWGQALEVGRNVGALASREDRKVGGISFQNWLLKNHFLLPYYKFSFFSKFLHPKREDKNIVPPHFSNMEHVQPRLIYDNRLPYVCLRVNLIYLLCFRFIYPCYYSISITIVYVQYLDNYNSNKCYLLYKSMERHKGKIYYQIKDPSKL